MSETRTPRGPRMPRMSTDSQGAVNAGTAVADAAGPR